MKFRRLLQLAALLGFSTLVNGQWFANHDLTTSQLQARFDTLTADGYRPVEISSFEVSGIPRFAVIWERRPSPFYGFYYGMSREGLETRDTDLKSDGFKMTVVDRYQDGTNDRFTAIWEKWNGPNRQRTLSISLADLTTEIANQASNGIHPLRIDVAPGTTSLEATVLWEQSDQFERRVLWGLDDESLATKLQPHFAEGYRPFQISSYAENGVGKSLVILEKSSGPNWFFRAGMTSAEYQAEFDAQLGQGFRPVSLSGYALSGAARYSAIWNRYERAAPPDDLPVSGLPRSGLEGLDFAMEQFMQERGITTGALCVAVGEIIVYERAFGWQDNDFSRPLRKSALFRTASLAKPITAAAVIKLANAGSLSLDSFVFDIGQPGGGLLSISPAGSPDPRLEAITVQHLLDHRGGWDRDISGDPVFNQYNIALDLGIPMPPSQIDITNWVAGQALDHTPGSTYAYSNFGYLLLGLIIEETTGMDATEWIQANLFATLGVPASEHQLARSLPDYRDSREPDYHDPFFGSFNVYLPDRHAQWQDGGWNIESMETHGGWIHSTRAYVRFLQNYWISGQPWEGGSASYTFFGSLNGTRTAARQLPNGVSYAAFFNQRSDSSGLSYTDNVDELDTAIANVVTWPLSDPIEKLPADPLLELRPESASSSANIHWLMEPGRVYQIYQSEDLENWSQIGDPILGDSPEPVMKDIQALLSGKKSFFYLGME